MYLIQWFSEVRQGNLKKNSKNLIFRASLVSPHSEKREKLFLTIN